MFDLSLSTYTCYFFFEGCHEYDETRVDWCADHYDLYNICNGSRNDCLKKGKAKCDKDWACHGIMFHAGWARSHKGVKVCKSQRMTRKGDWQAFMKLDENYLTN